MQALCLLCHTKLLEPKTGPIVQHYKKCSTQHQLTTEARNAIINANLSEPSNEIQFIYETEVTQRELDGQRRVNHGISAPGFLVSFIMTPKGLERIGECLVCKKSNKKPSQAYFAYHRYVLLLLWRKKNIQFSKLIHIFAFTISMWTENIVHFRVKYCSAWQLNHLIWPFRVQLMIQEHPLPPQSIAFVSFVIPPKVKHL